MTSKENAIGVGATDGVVSLSEFVYAQLRDAIFKGDLSPNQKVQQEEIAERLGTSRVPVREALKQLEGEGLVTLRPRRGFVVSSLDPATIEEVFDIRVMLEARAAYLGTLKRTDEDVAFVRLLFEKMQELVTSSTVDVDKFAQTNREFHLAIARPSGRSLHLRMLSVLRNQVEHYVRLSTAIATTLSRANSEHSAIFDAFASGDADKAGQLTRRHVEDVCERLLRELEAEGR